MITGPAVSVRVLRASEFAGPRSEAHHTMQDANPSRKALQEKTTARTVNTAAYKKRGPALSKTEDHRAAIQLCPEHARTL